MKRSSANLRYEAAVRVIADVIILNAALLASLVANHLTFPAGKSAGEAIVEPYLTKFWILTLIGISVFWLMGFYTRGRAYVGRYKAVIVLQGSTLAFLVFGFVTRFLARSGAVRLRSLLMS